MINKITVYCASSSNVSTNYLNSAYELGAKIALTGHEIIYGGGNVGLMGKLAEGAIVNGGVVTGVIPKFLMKLELGHTNISKLIITSTLHERQKIMMDKADVIMALPGGCGTFVELFEAITWKKLNRINCPIVIINLNGYYDDLINMLNKAIVEGFMREDHFTIWTVVADIDEAVRFLNKSYDYVNYDIV
jgi:uncharacterized protein (TIGR00730 family)